jgi:hypothetical protein
MSKRVWIILGVGLALIAGAFIIFKWENKVELEPEPEPVKKKPVVKAEPIKEENNTSDLNKAGDDEQSS